MLTNPSPSKSRLDAYGRRRLVAVVIVLLFAGVIYFVSAGRVNLPWGWVYLGAALFSLAAGGLYVLRLNPQVINERGRPAENQKSWDKILLRIYNPLFITIYVLAGLDARFGWSQVPLWLHLAGLAVTALSSMITYAAMAHNPFLAQVVQIAESRGHRVATSGPYRWVRHPMYVSIILSWPALALLLGSWWTLIPALLASSLIILRTVLEDRTLLAELPGYSEYAQRVHYRLLPGVW
jgi:protein-S-isoprenylcysteine O-methyltransferase Ste14